MKITDQKQIDRYYQALLNRDGRFLGIFFVGVKTTSVFCIATCRARKPKPENVEFYTKVKDLLENGYRPCKVCKPTHHGNDVPEDVKMAMELVKQNPKEKISDQMLRASNLVPEQLRRWFKKNYGITFQAYQRMYRINTAFKELKEGKNTTAVAFDSGYDSLSGFGYTFKKLLGESPQKSLFQQIILISRINTRIGPMFVCATEKGICLLEFVDRKKLETEFSGLQRLLKAKIMVGENLHIKQCRQEIEEYFERGRTEFKVLLDAPGTEFQQRVWGGLQRIPYGRITTYKEQATRLNMSTAVRAIASANGHNRISILIPCHRVIGSNGDLTGYGGGLERKKWLLDHEKKGAY